MSQADVRAALKSVPDGATVAELGRMTGKRPCNVRKALTLVRGAYVDRWTAAKGGPYRYAAVYVLHEGTDTPDNAPYPD